MGSGRGRSGVDVVIIGAGVIGAAVALELARRGRRTLNVDRLPAAGYGPTSNSCAIVRAHYSSFDGVALAWEGFAYWREWAGYLGARAGDVGLARYVDCGSVVLPGRNGHMERVLPLFEAVGVEHEVWDVERLRARFPIFDTRAFWPPCRPEDARFWEEPERELECAVHTIGAGYVSDPALATRNLQDAAEQHGAVFRFNASVVEVRSGDRVEGVTLADGERIDAPVVVNVAGPHSARVNAMAGVVGDMRIGTRALRHEVHHVPAPPGVDFEHDGMQVSDADMGTYFRPDLGNHILVGSEDPACDPHVWVEDPDDYDRTITEAQWEAQVYRLARRIPSLKVPSTRRGLVDLYDVSDDWIPIYDRSCLDGYYMAIGTSGNQFKNAAPVAHMMAELIDACEHGHDHDTTPLHVRTRHTHHELNLGFYSRNRPPNPQSSHSVIG